MKAGTTESLKFLRFQRRLRISKYEAIGILEGLWALTARSAPAGDIGRFSNEDIAAWLEFEGDEDDLIMALEATGFLDRCQDHRYVVHDWKDHAPTYVKGLLARYSKEFAKCRQVSSSEEAPIGGSLSTHLPSLVKSSQEHPHTPSRGEGAFFSLKTRGDAWRTWCESERCSPEQLAAQLEVTKDWTDAELIAAVTHAMANVKRSRLTRPKPDELSPVQSGKLIDDDDRAAERIRNQIIRRGRTLKHSPEQIDAALVAAGCETLNGKPECQDGNTGSS